MPCPGLAAAGVRLCILPATLAGASLSPRLWQDMSHYLLNTVPGTVLDASGTRYPSYYNGVVPGNCVVRVEGERGDDGARRRLRPCRWRACPATSSSR